MQAVVCAALVVGSSQAIGRHLVERCLTACQSGGFVGQIVEESSMVVDAAHTHLSELGEDKPVADILTEEQERMLV